MGVFGLKRARHLTEGFSAMRKKKGFKKKWQFLQEGRVPRLHRILPRAAVSPGICD